MVIPMITPPGHRGWKGQGCPGGAIAMHDDTKSSRIVSQLILIQRFSYIKLSFVSLTNK
jgi:hypothetical protein